MLTLDLTTLRLFLAVTREGSMHGAARSENIATSAVSRRINELEQTLGLRLLRRLPRGVELTAAGRLFADYGARILRQTRDLAAELESFSEGVKGEVRVAASSPAIRGPLPQILRGFCDDFPAVQLHLRETFNRDAVSALKDGAIDLAVIADNVTLDGLEYELFYPDPLWFVAPAGHHLLQGRKPGESIAFAEASSYEILILHEGGPMNELLTRAAEAEGHALQNRITLTRVNSLRRMIELGFGIGFMRKSSVVPFLDSMAIVGAPLSDAWAKQNLVIVSRGEAALTPATRLVLERLRMERQTISGMPTAPAAVKSARA